MSIEIKKFKQKEKKTMIKNFTQTTTLKNHMLDSLFAGINF